MSSTRMLASPGASILRWIPLALPLFTTGCFFATEPMPWQAGVAATAPVLRARAGCSLWEGSLSGNDPSVNVELELCPTEGSGEALHGRMQFTSNNSGWSIREVEGSVDASGAVTLHDVAFDVSKPELGWTFCLVDRYELEEVDRDRLVGQYHSNACHDHAHLDVVRTR